MNHEVSQATKFKKESSVQIKVMENKNLKVFN